MSINSIASQLRLWAMLTVGWFIEKIANLLGYPDRVRGMSINPDIPALARLNFMESLPRNPSNIPPQPSPYNIYEAILGHTPRISTINKTFFANADGYYNFYVPNYKNLWFLPDWLSKWIQINFDICVDTTILEIIRETLFILLVYYYHFIFLRLALNYFLIINPYTRPWVYILSLTDFFDDLLFNLGLSKKLTLRGIPVSPIIFSGIVGKIADSLNHLVFTMPFLPSEGQFGTIMINGEAKKVVIFRYLPSLWFTNPIPDSLREFWYTQRPDIYKFMKDNYGHLDIDFLPDRVLKKIYESHQNYSDYKPLVENVDKMKTLSTHIVSDSAIYFHEFGHYLTHKQEILSNLVFDHIDKLS